jgi:Polysaccharide lyase
MDARTRASRSAMVRLVLACLAVLAVLDATPASAQTPELLNWEDHADRTVPGSAPPGWTRQMCYPGCGSHPAQVVTKPVRDGSYAARFQLKRSDPDVNSSKRSELAQAQVTPNGAERWYGFSILLPSSSFGQVDPRSAEIVAQWHHAANTGSPPLALGVLNGRWTIWQHWKVSGIVPVETGRWTDPTAHALGQWTDWVVHVTWSSGSTGSVEVWKDGQLVYDVNGKNKDADDPGVYMKFGIYKWDWKSNPTRPVDNRVLFHDALRIADHTGSYGSVAPR